VRLNAVPLCGKNQDPAWLASITTQNTIEPGRTLYQASNHASHMIFRVQPSLKELADKAEQHAEETLDAIDDELISISGLVREFRVCLAERDRLLYEERQRERAT